MKTKLSDDLLWLCPTQADDLIRLGGHQDGGYVVPFNAIEEADGLLSYGLGQDWSFDEAWANLKPGTPVHMYDGTGPQNSFAVEPKIKYFGFFHKHPHIKHWFQNVGPVTTPDGHVCGFAESVERIGVDNVFVKMDIECGEFPIIDDIVSQHDKIVGIVIEFHQAIYNLPRIKEAVDKFKQYYKIVHLHGNTHTMIGQSGLTDCIELTLVRNDLALSDDLRRDVYLPHLDYTNNMLQQDVEFYFE
jgi:hypothetical protein